LQQWFNLSDPAVEEVLYDSPALRGFVGIDPRFREGRLSAASRARSDHGVPLRHLKHDLGRHLFDYQESILI
jgi:IS5 family transposase